MMKGSSLWFSSQNNFWNFEQSIPQLEIWTLKIESFWCNGASSDKHDYTSDYHIVHVYFFHVVFGENLDRVTCKIKLCSN